MSDFDIKQAMADGFDPTKPRKRFSDVERIKGFLRRKHTAEEWLAFYITWRIRKIRFEKGITQSQLGNQINISHKEQFSGNGYRVDNLMIIADRLSVPPSELLPPSFKAIEDIRDGLRTGELKEFEEAISSARDF